MLEVNTYQLDNPKYIEQYRQIAIPAYSGDGCYHYFFYDFQTNILKKYRLDLSSINNAYFDYLNNQYNFIVKDNYLVDLIPHTCIIHKDKIYLFLLNSYYFMIIDIKTDQIQIVEDPDKKMISSTNIICNNELFYARYSVDDRYHNLKDKMDMYTEVVKMDLDSFKLKIVCNFQSCDVCHSVSISPDEKYIIAITAKAESVMGFKEYKSQYSEENLKEIAEKGICKSQIHIYSTINNKYKEIESYKTPAHTEFSNDCADFCYVSAHNVCGNPYSGVSYCMGQASILKLKLSDDSKIIDSYTADDLFRIPCHKLYRKNNVNYILANSYPQQMHIINADTMKSVKKVNLSNDYKKTTMEKGAFRYPRTDQTPFSVFPCDDTCYVYTVDKKNISLFDTDKDEIISQIPYNVDNRPFIIVGHSDILKNRE